MSISLIKNILYVFLLAGNYFKKCGNAYDCSCGENSRGNRRCFFEKFSPTPSVKKTV